MKKILCLGFTLFCFASNVSALDFGVGAKVGTNGTGLDLTVGLKKNLNLRVTAAAIDIDDESETVTVGDDGFEGDIDADLDFDYGANAVLLDWHAFNSGFRFTVGMMKNNGSADIDGVLLSAIVIDGDPLDPSDLVGGAVGGDLDLGDSYQPYVGIGWGRGAGGKGGFSFSADLGIAVLDTDIDLEADADPGGTYTQSQLDPILKNLEKDAEDELDDFELWPVLAIGVNYAF